MFAEKSKLALVGGALFSVATVFSFDAMATDGYFSNGYGNASKGMAGAGVAMSLDTQAAVNNPAGMYALGDRMDLELSIFSPRRDATVEVGNGFFDAGAAKKHESGSKVFYVPAFGINFDQGEYTLGLTLSANGGMNTDYDDTIFAGGTSGKTGVDLAQVFLGATYARKLNDVHTIGITPTLAAQRFKATGLQGFGGISSNSNKLTDNGYDYSYGYGFRLGWQGKISELVTVGATYQSRTYMQRFEKYSGLFAEQGDFDIPQTVAAGVAVKATPELTLLLDYKLINYSSVAAIANTNTTTAGTFPLGTDTGMGFGWEDMDIVKLGLQYEASPELTVRAGYSHNTKAFAGSENIFNILAPAVVQDHLSIGASYKPADNHEVGFAFTRAFSNTISSDNNTNHGGNNLDLQMNQYELNLAYSLKF